MFQILFCDEPGIVRIVYMIKVILNLVKFILPIGLIIMVSLDIYKNMLHGYGNNKENIIKKAGNRVLACIIVFCIPTAVDLIIDIISTTGINANQYTTTFANCYQEASQELIAKLEEEKKLKLAEAEEKERKEMATLIAKMKAEAKAKIEANQKLNGTLGSNTGSYSSNTTDLNKQNKVYIQNGVFYAPKFVDGNESTYSGKECPSNPLSQGYNNKYGFNNYFWTMLQNLIQGAKNAGYNLSHDTEGCRTYNTQYTFYYNTYKNQPGRAAKPGRSLHGWGIASDLTFYKDANTKCGNNRTRSNCPGMAWVHDHAKDYGLEFPLLNASYKEDWHIQPINIKRY